MEDERWEMEEDDEMGEEEKPGLTICGANQLSPFSMAKIMAGSWYENKTWATRNKTTFSTFSWQLQWAVSLFKLEIRKQIVRNYL